MRDMTKTALVVGLAAIVYGGMELWDRFGTRADGPLGSAPTHGAPARQRPSAKAVDAAVGAGDARIARAFESRESDFFVESTGIVERVLSDDLEGSRHQRFIVRLATGTTVLVAHNIDLAPRVPLSRGDSLDFRGEYEWNDRGGVIHWTHHDPRGSKEGGWLRHAGKTYK